MSLTLKAKLVTATVASIGTIAALVFTVAYGFSVMAERLAQSAIVTTAVRNQTNAEVMHDAVRADVFAALRFATSARERRNEIVAKTKADAAEFQRFLAENNALGLAPEVKAVLHRLDEPMAIYVASAEHLVEEAFESDQNVAASHPPYAYATGIRPGAWATGQQGGANEINGLGRTISMILTKTW